MITAMVKLPDGKVLNKVLFTDEELAEDDVCHCNEKVFDLDHGVVSLAFDNGMRITTHWSNVVLIAKNSQ